LSTNKNGEVFGGPDWAMAGVQSAGTVDGADDPGDENIHRCIMIRYMDGAEPAILADIDDTEAFEAAAFASSGADFASAVGGAEPEKIKINYKFPDLNTVVLTAPQRSLKWPNGQPSRKRVERGDGSSSYGPLGV
jgi:hypothetical protein